MPKDIADQLRAAIIRSGYSASELARQTGLNQETISGFLRGRDMGIERASKIAAYLGLSLNRK